MTSSPLQLDVESLRTFLAVLDHGGMTRAAERLDMTQSAVSWKVKRLEQRIGRPLLIRNGHALRPTRDARALIPDARAMIEIHDRAASRLKSSELTGMVRLGSNEEVDPARMASLLGRFKCSHPGAAIEFVIDHTDNLIEQLDRGEVDVAIIQVADGEVLSSDEVLWTDRLMWVTCCERFGHEDDWFEDGPVPLISFGEQCFYRALSEPFLDEAGIEYSVTFSASSVTGVRAAISAGIGIGVLGSRYLDGDIVAWERAATLPELPVVHQIARAAPGETADITTALVAAIADELLDPVNSF